MSLLEKTRKLSKLLQERDNAQYQDVANLMSDVIEANVILLVTKAMLKVIPCAKTLCAELSKKLF